MPAEAKSSRTGVPAEATYRGDERAAEENSGAATVGATAAAAGALSAGADRVTGIRFGG